LIIHLALKQLVLTNVLVIGFRGCSHALSWKLSQNAKVEKVFTAPENGGTQDNIDISVDDFKN
jgi:phosphoribosylamine--glycine ligase